ncbi:MAG: PIN domain-containing protein [Bifidobacteriaceae bacterium]|jgi:predicted nucleic acid-binding protein|nr:PIN domain-containing protein [Bifidobacteriaceae bacterium]
MPPNDLRVGAPAVVFVDANVLYSRMIRDWLFLLKLESGRDLFAVHTSEDVIAEMLYRLRRNNPQAPGELVSRIHDRIVDNIDERVTAYRIDGSFPGQDRDDQHVDAAAKADRADYLLTDDRGFFAAYSRYADPPGYQPCSPDEFFGMVHHAAPEVTRATVARMVSYWENQGQSPNSETRLESAGCPALSKIVARIVHPQAIRPLGSS